MNEYNSYNRSTIRIGALVNYLLLPKDRPAKPERLWMGKVVKCYGDYFLVECMEPGYEGMREIITRSQIQQGEGQE